MNDVKKFESMYRKARRGKFKDSEILNALISELGGNDIYYRNWLWNLQNDVHLNETHTFKELCRTIFVSYNEITWESFYGDKGDA